MATGELVMPKLGLTMTEGTLGPWLIERGGRFAAGATLVTVETDKIAYEVEAPAPGILQEVLAPEGSVVAVGAPIARWDLEGGQADTSPPAATAAAQHEPAGQAASPPPASSLASRAGNGSTNQRIVATPYARRLAREQAIDLSRVQPAGDGRRIRAADVLRAREEDEPRSPQPAVETPSDTLLSSIVFAGIEVDIAVTQALCDAISSDLAVMAGAGTSPQRSSPSKRGQSRMPLEEPNPSLSGEGGSIRRIETGGVCSAIGRYRPPPAAFGCHLPLKGEDREAAAMPMRPAPLHFVVLAVAKALAAAATGPACTLALSWKGSPSGAAILNADSLRSLSAVVAAMESPDDAVSGSEPLFLILPASGSVGLIAQTPPKGCAAVLGIGAASRQQIQLTLAARTEAFDPAAAQDLLERIKILLETPMRLLVA